LATLIEDISKQSTWIVARFSDDGFNLDYTIHSFIEIDRFFNEHSKNGNAVKGGRLEKNLGNILFSIGSYIGETMIQTVPGTIWITNDLDPEGEVNAEIKFPDGWTIWPMQRAIRRFKNGEEDSIYVYGHHFIKVRKNESFDETYWDINKNTKQINKPWWKFW
jgi:hypothetical protein